MTTSIIRTFTSILCLATISVSIIACSNDDEQPVNSSETVMETETEDTKPEVSLQDPMEHGEQAHKDHCYKCHTDDIYTREDRIVKSLDALSQQVDRCKDGTGAPWFDQDAAAVVQFLNEKYYRF